MYSKLSKKENFRKAPKSLYIILTTPDEVEKYIEVVQSYSSNNCVHCYNIEILNLFDSELKPLNTKPMIRIKLKELLSDLKKFKAQAILVLEYKKGNNIEIFHLCTVLVVSDSDSHEVFISMLQRVITKKNYDSEAWISLDVITWYSIKFFYVLV